jgi:hypothetical protein
MARLGSIFVVALCCALSASPALAGDPQPAPVRAERPPGWDPIGTDPDGNRWMLYQDIKPTGVAGNFHVRLDMTPGEGNQAAKEAGATGFRYFVDVDCNAHTLLYRSFTGYAKDGHSEDYQYPEDTQPQAPSADSVFQKVFPLVCK